MAGSSVLSRRLVVRLIYSAVTVLVSTILLGSATLSQSDSRILGVSANDLVQRVITNELNFQGDHTNWMYRLEKEQYGKKQVEEIVETKEGSLSRLLSINDRPPYRETTAGGGPACAGVTNQSKCATKVAAKAGC